MQGSVGETLGEKPTWKIQAYMRGVHSTGCEDLEWECVDWIHRAQECEN